MSTEISAAKQRGRPFQPGRSGNPSGKPRGARHKITLAAEALLDGEAEALTRRAIELALGGDTTALRLCLDRIIPPRRDRPVRLGMPPLVSAADAAIALSSIASAVTEGDVTPTEGAVISELVSVFVKAIEVADLEKRLVALEERLTNPRSNVS